MTIFLKTAVAAALFAVPVLAAAEAVQLSPADPQPAASSLSPGLAVVYAFPGDVRTVKDARNALKRKTVQGPPLAGLSYDDTTEGDETLTSGKAMKIAADISGFIKFDAPGTYVLDFLNNDGLEISIGGEIVGDYDEVHTCGYAGEIEVEVPVAGYYPLQATYFQRKGTACLMMEWGPDSDGLELVPDSVFFH
ncbi:PA14 domain-containing protein [Roseobacter sinensis]|uniref:PA14 domain-containing protein n=1 Tax=Roseobacter sinensis TaxID=2931391 RepID=A0ABT3BFE6_9RHOB|nr:PA14 domain-containing protein [Roseobacter sp. WL0113]MCV3272109.1 PA14 domain-containing protein [Roseobacter sp. WL0113]